MKPVQITAKQWLHTITASIAFYPVMVALALIALGLVTVWVEYQPWLMKFKGLIGVVLVDSIEDGRLILGTLVASTISLMVFSFSMVMVVLNQASANLSPRLLPGLITVKGNQVVLGFYLGTVCYCLMLILNIHPNEETARLPSFGILIGMCLGLSCLGFFTYFIHWISQAIQVDNILDQLFQQTCRKLELNHVDSPMPEPEPGEWHTLDAPKAGYLKWIEQHELMAVCVACDVKVRLIERVGYFHVTGEPFLLVNKPLDDETKNTIHQCFVFYPQDRLGDHFCFGFTQISEVAVKALSASFSDPTTAMKAIDMLVMLLICKCKGYEKSVVEDSQGTPRIFLKATPLTRLLVENITPIRAYAQRDTLVLMHLLDGLNKVLSHTDDSRNREALLAHMVAVRDRCDRAIDIALDRDTIDNQLTAINRQIGHEALKPLS